MKTLYLVRHAKSSWHDSTLADRDRPLEPRGERDAAKMSKRWSHRDVKPDLIISSPAARALATARSIAARLDYKRKGIIVDDRLYGATADDLIRVVEDLDDHLGCVMLVGHNPGLADLAHHFDGDITAMPTCSLADFTFDVKAWSHIGAAKPVRTIFDSPKR